MADKKARKEKVKAALKTFRTQLRDREKVKETILEGLKSTNSKVRATAARAALKTQEFEFVKKNIIPLVKSEKSARVLKNIKDRVYREEIVEKIKSLVGSRAKKKEAKEETAAT